MRKDHCTLVILLKTGRHDSGSTHFVTIWSFAPQQSLLLRGIRTFPITQAYWRETKEEVRVPRQSYQRGN